MGRLLLLLVAGMIGFSILASIIPFFVSLFVLILIFKGLDAAKSGGTKAIFILIGITALSSILSHMHSFFGMIHVFALYVFPSVFLVAVFFLLYRAHKRRCSC